MLLKWKYIHGKNYAIFGRYDAKAKLFCQKSFVPVTGLECSYGKDFEPGNRDLGKRASPVDRADVKRPFNYIQVIWHTALRNTTVYNCSENKKVTLPQTASIQEQLVGFEHRCRMKASSVG